MGNDVQTHKSRFTTAIYTLCERIKQREQEGNGKWDLVTARLTVLEQQKPVPPSQGEKRKQEEIEQEQQ